MTTLNIEDQLRSVAFTQRRADWPRTVLLAEVEGLPDDAYVTARHAAAFLGTTPQTLANWRYKRQGPAYSGAKGFIRYRLRDLKAFMAQRASEVEAVAIEDAP
jgi:hypothetical protein